MIKTIEIQKALRRRRMYVVEKNEMIREIEKLSKEIVRCDNELLSLDKFIKDNEKTI